jgi:hypothetical protein
MDFANSPWDGKISRDHLSMLGWFAYILDDMAEKIIWSENGWGESRPRTEAQRDDLQLEREQLKTRIKQINAMLAAHENDLPAS